MSKDIQVANELAIIDDENIQNVSSLLSLLHGKTDSICKIFHRDAIVDLEQLCILNSRIEEKLFLHQINATCTTIDISLSNHKVITLKSWNEFRNYNWSFENHSTETIFIEWDFFLKLDCYKVPQRHTLSIRLTSSPKPSDLFKALLNDALDNASSLETSMSSMICKVDFINNSLAEELINIVDSWYKLCESAIGRKGNIKTFLFRKRMLISRIFGFIILTIFALIIAIVTKLLIENNIIKKSIDNFFYLLLLCFPMYFVGNSVARKIGGNIIDKFEDLIETHDFVLTKGDEKLAAKLEKESRYSKEVWLFCINIAISIVLSIIFYKI